jgi:predicted Zn-dependent protease
MRTDIAKLVIAVLLVSWQTFAHANQARRCSNFQKQGQVYDDPRWHAYREDRRASRRLQPRPNGKFYFTVVDMPDVNAFATPEGYIFVYRGLLAYLESEDQLAAVIGHEIGHVVAHHSRKMSAMSNAGKVVGFVGAVITGVGQVNDVTTEATDTAVMGYGRDMELQADQLGGEFIAPATTRLR